MLIFLAKQGIKHVFVVTGGAALHLIDSVARHPDIDYVAPLHEQAAAMAVDAYTRVNGNMGAAMAKRWKTRGWDILGTYRTSSSVTQELENIGISLVRCDLADTASIDVRLAFNLRHCVRSGIF